MRLEYKFDLSEIVKPRFSVEAEEGIGKLFKLSTLVLNVLETHKCVEIVFHGLNRDDPSHKIELFKEILGNASGGQNILYELGNGGPISRSSAYYQWIQVSRP